MKAPGLRAGSYCCHYYQVLRIEQKQKRFCNFLRGGTKGMSQNSALGTPRQPPSMTGPCSGVTGLTHFEEISKGKRSQEGNLSL